MKGVFLLIAFAFTHFCVAQPYPKMIKLEGGTFDMGAGNTSILPSNPFKLAQSAHKVYVKSFGISQTEITVLQWKTYCEATGRALPEVPKWGWKNDDPIVNINWNDAVAYCTWLSNKIKKNYRLPTEAEWEYAARGGNRSKGYKYSGGENLDSLGWYDGNSNKMPHKVASKRANEIGLYDMSGNVWEWCNDWNGPYPSGAVSNPTGPGTGEYRIVRGGSFRYSNANSLVINRNIRPPKYIGSSVGFRVVSPE